MNNYTINFININNLDKDVDFYDFFEYSQIRIFKNLETYCYLSDEKFTFALKPLIKFLDDYHSLENFFNVAIKNGLNAYTNYREIKFDYSVKNIENGNFLVNFAVDCDYSRLFAFDFLLIIKFYENICSVKKLSFSVGEYICYKIGENTPIYILSNSLSSINFNSKVLFGNKIKKEQEKALYCNFKINSLKNKNISVYFLNDIKYVKQLLKDNKLFIKNNTFVKNFMLDIYSNNNSFDIMCDSIIENIYYDFFKSMHTSDNFFYKLNYLLQFDKSFIKYVFNYGKNNLVNNLQKLHTLLNYYNLYGLTYFDITEQLIKDIERQFYKLLFEEYHYLIDILVDFNKIGEKCKLKKMLVGLIKKINLIIVTINFNKIIKNFENNINFDSLILCAKYTKYYDRALFNELIDILLNINFFDNLDILQKENLFVLLYYVYCLKTKDKIFSLLSKSNNYNIEKLKIVTECIVGYKYENNLIDVNANLPSRLSKVVLNYRFNKGIYTIIAKKSADIFSVNDICYDEKVLVKASQGYIKIICSSS